MAEKPAHSPPEQNPYSSPLADSDPTAKVPRSGWVLVFTLVLLPLLLLGR